MSARNFQGRKNINMRIKMISSYTDKDTGVSKVILECGGKRYEGYAQFNYEVENPECWSEIAGCHYAHFRALRKIWQERLAELRQQRKAIKRYYDMIKGSKDCSLDSPEAKRLYKFMKCLEKEICEIKTKINSVSEEYIKKHDEKRHLIIEKYSKKDT